jgi:hypothetical protein
MTTPDTQADDTAATDNGDTTEPAQEDYAGLTDEDDAVPDDQPTGQAKLRRRAQAAEAERDALQQRLEVLQRGEVERHAATALADPSDLWTVGTDLGAVLDDAGNIDPAKVDAVVADVLASHSHWAVSTPQPRRQYAHPVSGASAQPTAPRSDPWVKAFSPQER